jgi:hypothetical protein
VTTCCAVLCCAVQANVWGTEVEEGLQLDAAKVREALKKQEKLERQRQQDEEGDDRKRRWGPLFISIGLFYCSLSCLELSSSLACWPQGGFLCLMVLAAPLGRWRYCHQS